MKTYKFYLNSSEYFLSNSKLDNLASLEKEKNMFASIIFSWLALESYVNSACESLSKGTRLKPHEKAFLEEKELRVNDEGEFREVLLRPSTTKKILFIIENFTNVNVKSFKQTKIWKDIKNLEYLRDRIIHHKEKEEINLNIKKCEDNKKLIDSSIIYLDKKLFRKR